jgi:proline iminopeptidase
MIMDHQLYPVTAPREERMLKVSEIHTLHYAVYGNPDGTPVVVLHGGPGAGCDDSQTKFFDLNKWNVVMFDQRGAMKSTPFACMEENTPQHSVRDIEMLREHLGIDKWAVFGGSWGSTLALLYGQAHPDRCLGFMLRGIFFAREPDYLHLVYGMGKLFPEAYAPFVNYVPEDERGDLLTAYYLRLMDQDPAIHLPAAKTFMKYDLLCSTFNPNPEAVEKVLQNDRMLLSITRVYFYYSMNRFFLEPDQILSNMHLIEHLPAIIVHGSGDLICLPEMATLLHQKWKNSHLWMIPSGGHSAINDPAIASAVAASTDTFLRGDNL